MKILVTGGAGFIGSFVVRALLNHPRKPQVVNLDKLTYCGDLTRLKGVANHPRYRFVKADVACREDLDKALKGCDGVIHLAAETHVDRSLIDAKVFFETNIYGTALLIQSARRQKIKRYVQVSTDEVYGSIAKGSFSESDRLNPTSPYAVSKASGDMLVLSSIRVEGLNASITRGCNAFGPYQYPEKVIPLFVSNAALDKPLPLYGKGQQRRTWLWVEDHASAIVTVFFKGKKGGIYNIASEEEVTNLALTREILKQLGKSQSLIKFVKDRPGHDLRYSISARRLKGLGWKPRFRFKEALRQTVRWYLENRSWWEEIKEKNKEYQAYYKVQYGERL